MLATQDVYPSSTAHLTNEERREALIRKRRVLDLQELSFAQEAAEFAASDAWDEDGSASAIDWIRFNCHMTSSAAANSIAVGEAMNRTPKSIEATFQGEIGYAHLVVMARTAQALEERFDETALLDKARENSPGKFHYICIPRAVVARGGLRITWCTGSMAARAISTSSSCFATGITGWSTRETVSWCAVTTVGC